MRHFIAYHNADRMGYADIERLRVLTSKPVGNDLIGHCVWLIVGKGKREKTYFLGSRFTIADIAESEVAGFAHQVIGHHGRVFAPLVPLADLDWFNDFRRSIQNFSLGFRKITDQQVIRKFEELAASVEHQAS